MRSMRRLLAGRERGAALTEYMALIALLGLVVGAVALNAGGIGALLADGIGDAICRAIGTGCGTGGVPGAPGPRDPSAPPPPIPGLPEVPGPGADPGLGEGPGGGGHGTDPSGEQSDPVNSLTGAFVTTGHDAVLPGRGVSFTLQRSYSSSATASGWLGRGWRLGLEIAVVAGDATTTVLTETGQRLTYHHRAGAYVPARGVRSTLARDGDGWRLQRPDLVTYAFDAAGRLTSVVDPAGDGLTVEWAGGRPAAVTDADGRVVAFDADSGGRVTAVRLPDGASIAYRYTGGLLSSVTDPRGGVTRYTYDAEQRLVTVTDASGATTVTNVYGADGRVAQQVDALGNRTTFRWDAASRTQTMVDARGGAWSDVYRDGVLVARVDPLGGTRTFTYDADLNLVAATDALGATTTITYDDRGRPTAITRADGVTERFGYDPAGLLAEVTDGAGTVTTVQRDARGRVTGVTFADDTRVSVRYDAAGRPTAVTDPAGAVTRVGYDDRGNLDTFTTPGGATLRLDHDAVGRAIGMVDPRGEAWSYGWDASGNLLEATTPLGSTTRVERDAVGRVTAVTDPAGATTRYAYDAMGHLATVTAADGATTTYAYDATGNVTVRRTPLGDTTRYAYDAANRLVAVSAPGGQRYAYAHDAAGRVTTVTLPSGTATPDPDDGTIHLTSDALGRVVAVTYSDGTPPVGLRYDAIGNLVEIRDGEGTLTREHDALGRLLRVARNGEELAAYTYDAVGRTRTRTFGEAVQTTTYTADGLPEEVTDGALSARYAYDPAGHLLTATLGNGVVEARTYDAGGRLTGIAADGPAGPVSAVGYVLDTVGNPLAVQHLDHALSYAYDARHRLVAACSECDGSDGLGFGYDASSRRTLAITPDGTTRYAYDASDRLVAAAGPDGAAQLRYDANGNLAQDAHAAYTSNLAGQVTTVTPLGGGTATTYAYDGLGRRVAAGDARAVWDELAPNARLVSEGGRAYGFGAGRLGFTNADGTATYLHADAQGSIVAATGFDGATDWRYRYAPFGAREAERLDPEATDNPIGFGGELTDPDGRLHLRARTYDPQLGVFAQVDPVSAAGSQPYASVYAFAGNRPTAATDPSGACPFCPDIDLDDLVPDVDLPDVDLPDVSLPSLDDVGDLLGGLPITPVLPPIGPVTDLVDAIIDDPWGALQVVNTASGWIATGAGVVAAGAGACAALVVTLPVCGTIAAGAGTVATVSGAVALGSGAILTGRDCANAGIGSVECITGIVGTVVGAGNTALGRWVRQAPIDDLTAAGIGFVQAVGGRLFAEGLNWIEDLLTDDGPGSGGK